MPKEDRSDWVAVAPQFDGSNGDGGIQNKIEPAQTAFALFQKEMTDQVKTEAIAANNGKFEVGLFSKAMRDRWNALDVTVKEPYENLARKDQFRFRSESHQADVAAIERRERLQREREILLLDDEGGTQRGTRGRRAKKERKEKKRLNKQQKKKKKESTVQYSTYMNCALYILTKHNKTQRNKSLYQGQNLDSHLQRIHQMNNYSVHHNYCHHNIQALVPDCG